jgi:hypothetical protein
MREVLSHMEYSQMRLRDFEYLEPGSPDERNKIQLTESANQNRHRITLPVHTYNPLRRNKSS